MHEPRFWYRPSSWMSRLLIPLGALYGAVAVRRMEQPGTKVGIPVLCVGNYHVGGAGKTPVTMALVKLLRDLGEVPVVLSRGYGGRLQGPVCVDLDRHAAADVGDEPLMMARTVAVVVSRDRIAGAVLARARGATLIVMDDGFQNPSIFKDASLIVIDGDRGLGNGRVVPAGPLRAPLRQQMARTDALIIVGDGVAAGAVAAVVASKGGLVLRAHLRPDQASLEALRGNRVLAFAGIGDPPRFFATLRAAGIEVVVTKAFPDHHRFSAIEIQDLIALARRESLALVATEKDLARLGSHAASLSMQIMSFKVTLEFDDPDKLRAFVRDRLAKARTNKFRTGNSR